MIQIMIRVTDTQLEKLKRTRRLNGTSVTQTIRYAINEYYERQQSKLETRQPLD